MKRSDALARVGGLSASRLVMPVVLILAALHLIVIALIVMINTSSAQLSAIMRDSGAYTQEATSLLGSSSLLSETSSHFVLMPLTETGEINVSPLIAYAMELKKTEHRGDVILENFRGYGVDAKIVERLSEAATSANYLMDSQLHAIALINAVHPIPNVQPLNTIPIIDLTDAEQAMTDAQKATAARNLVLGSLYGLNKQSVSSNVNSAVSLLQARSGQYAAETSRRIAVLRVGLWVNTLSIMVILLLVFGLLYVRMLHPLQRFVHLIPENQLLDEYRGFHEVRLVAAAYNDVLQRRDALDAILRSAAETDALTNLPNRYRFEQYLLEAEDSGHSAAVMLFDVDYLKRTNDTLGHLAGDNLIRSAAECISESFGENCFRFGGDEFAAIVPDCTLETLRQMVSHFEAMEKQQHISVSMGFAFAADIGSTTYKQLLDEADRNMYAQKKKTHRRD